jgi:hypothetical protein
MGALSTDPFRGLGLNKRRPKADPVLGREVTWTEDGRQLAGQVWAPCPDNGGEAATAYGPLYWVVVAGGREFRVASHDKAAGTLTVGYWAWSPGGRCLRDGKASA